MGLANGPLELNLRFYTDTVPSGSPTNVVAVAKSISSISVTWGRVPEFKRNGNVTMYDIHVMNSSHYVANISVCANNFSVVVDELEMFVTYYVRVRALTAVGFGPWSPNVTVATNQRGMTPLNAKGICMPVLYACHICSVSYESLKPSNSSFKRH